ncbi:MAG: hypothetical protein ABEI53_02990 [Candidatus Magasanikbacteria bacterium]
MDLLKLKNRSETLKDLEDKSIFWSNLFLVSVAFLVLSIVYILVLGEVASGEILDKKLFWLRLWFVLGSFSILFFFATYARSFFVRRKFMSQRRKELSDQLSDEVIEKVDSVIKEMATRLSDLQTVIDSSLDESRATYNGLEIAEKALEKRADLCEEYVDFFIELSFVWKKGYIKDEDTLDYLEARFESHEKIHEKIVKPLLRDKGYAEDYIDDISKLKEGVKQNRLLMD